MKNLTLFKFLQILAVASLTVMITANSVLGQMDLSMRVGLNAPSLSDDETNIFARDFNSNISLEVALGLEMPISSRLTFHPELVYTTRSGKREGVQPIPSNALPPEFGQLLGNETVLFADFNTVSSPSYFDIPLILKYYLTNPEKKISFYVEGGFQFGFLLNAKLNTSGNSPIYLDENGNNLLPLPPPIPEGFAFDFSRTENRSDILHSLNYGIQYGLGLAYNTTSDARVILNIRVAQGLRSIQRDPAFGRTKVGGVVFSLGFATPF